MKKRDLISAITWLPIAVAVIGLIMYVLLGVTLNKMRVKADVAPVQNVSQENESENVGEAVPEETVPPTTEAPQPTVALKDPEYLPSDREMREITVPDIAYIDALPESYDGTTVNYYVGMSDVAADEYNRPVVATELKNSFAEDDVRLTVYCADELTAKAAFTFNCGGESSGVTEEILDVLKNHKIKGTFFVSHAFALHNTDLVRRMISEGHEIGSLSYICPKDGIATYPPDDLANDANNQQKFMETAYGINMQKYSLNQGVWSRCAVKLLSDMNYEVCFFSSNIDDSDPETEMNAEEVVSNLEKNLHNGCVYNFNTVHSVVPEVLDTLITFTLEQGFTIVQLD